MMMQRSMSNLVAMVKPNPRGMLPALLLWIALLLTACGSAPPTPQAVDIGERAPMDSTDSLEEPIKEIANPASGLPASLESYYKTMVYIEGTAQLMAKLDLATLSNDSTGFLPLFAIPGMMDNRVLATEETPMPDGLAPAWAKALEARDGILQGFEALLMTSNQDDFLAQLGVSLALASEAVAETEALAASDFGATAESIALANRAALNEMGEDYQAFASMILVGQSQGDENSE